MLIILLALTVPVSTAALLYARWEYRRRGKLTLLGLALVSAMLFVPNLILEYATTYERPSTVLDFVGVLVGGSGLALCLISVTAFRSVPKTFCIDAGNLTTAGPYRWSRNPQYVGWVLFLLGFALNDWSLWCLAALLTVAISLHLLVLVEEEHLRRVFGEKYVEFCRKVPRYAGRVKAGG
ncbi:MAG: isoprenylcysteine carboxylmethyltransferase family protein [Acidobacteriota bacterium]|nr:MAG: isoprenylcysteine carboxylmethyltransferase family protein [Acidobacteriota bacterium]